MPPIAAAPDFTAILEHSLWVRRLAGTLVRDDARAEDLTQEAWVSVLRHPPAAELPVRPWLGQVVRNLARMSFRGERRRRGREEAVVYAHPPEPQVHTASPEELVERVQVQRTLAGLVVALAEPYRSTVLLRYYEGLSAAEIATRQAVPAGTVRWRLKKALEQLRTELDRSHGGDRHAWLPILAPLADGLPRPVGANVSTATVTKVKGVMIMKPLIAAVVLVAGAVSGVVAPPPKTPAPSSPAAVVAPRPARPSAPGKAPARLDKQQRTLLLEHIQQAQRKGVTPRPRLLPRSGASLEGDLDKDYVRAQIQLLIPLVKECYENALLRSHFDGKLVVNFTIVAAKDIGGLVTDSSIDTAQSTITDVAMRECVQETMYAAQFNAPSDGGEVHVTYPFEFRAAE